MCVNTKSSLDLQEQKWACTICDDGGCIQVISVPYVFRYFVAELAGMNISLKIESR